MWTLPLDGNEGLALFVIERMRDWDRREVFATRFDDDETALLREMSVGALHGQQAWIAGRDDCPVAVYGHLPLWPGVWSMWLVATDNFRSIGKSMTRQVRDVILPALFGAGAHRLECRSMEGHSDAHRWLELLGARREATHRGYGRGGEDFHLYVWEAARVLR